MWFNNEWRPLFWSLRSWVSLYSIFLNCYSFYKHIHTKRRLSVTVSSVWLNPFESLSVYLEFCAHWYSRGLVSEFIFHFICRIEKTYQEGIWDTEKREGLWFHVSWILDSGYEPLFISWCVLQNFFNVIELKVGIKFLTWFMFVFENCNAVVHTAVKSIPSLNRMILC